MAKFTSVEHLTLDQVVQRFENLPDEIRREMAMKGLVQEAVRPDCPDTLDGIIDNFNEVPRVITNWTTVSNEQLGDLYNYYIAWSGYLGVELASYKNSFAIAKAAVPKIRAAVIKHYRENEPEASMAQIREEYVPLHPRMQDADERVERLRGLVNHIDAMSEALRRAVRGLSREMSRRGLDWDESGGAGGGGHTRPTPFR